MINSYKSKLVDKIDMVYLHGVIYVQMDGLSRLIHQKVGSTVVFQAATHLNDEVVQKQTQVDQVDCDGLV